VIHISYLTDIELFTSQQTYISEHKNMDACLKALSVLNLWNLQLVGLYLHNRRLIDITYFDFSKAFDSVSHPELINKLSGYGLIGRLLIIFSAGRYKRRARYCRTEKFR